jgi:hypothetical protein
MFLKKEPALIISGAQAIIALVLSFGFNLPAKPMGIILALTAITFGLLIRTQVYSANTVQQAMKPSPEDLIEGGIGPKAIKPTTGDS